MIKECAWCRRPFKTQWHEKLYCCKDCRHKARKKREREHRRMQLEAKLMEQFSPARIKLIHIEHQRRFLVQLIENEYRVISTVNVIEKFQPNFFAADEDYLTKWRDDAIRNINELNNELKILDLKYKAANDAMTDDDWETTDNE